MMLRKIFIVLLAFLFALPLFAEKKSKGLEEMNKEDSVIEGSEQDEAVIEERIKKRVEEREKLRDRFKKMEKKLLKKGVDKKTIMVANESCNELCKAGMIPEEAEKEVVKSTLKYKKQGLKGKKLADAVRKETANRIKVMKRSKLQEKEIKKQKKTKVIKQKKIESRKGRRGR